MTKRIMVWWGKMVWHTNKPCKVRSDITNGVPVLTITMADDIIFQATVPYMYDVTVEAE